MSKPKCSVFIAMSLDGYIATPDNGLEWLKVADKADEDYGYYEFFASVDAIVVGRNTYDVACKFPKWPYENKKVFVLTHRPIDPKYNEVTVSGSLKEIFKKLESDNVKHIYLDGGKAIQAGLEEGVVGELTVSIIPMLLGKGIPLFGDLSKHMKLDNISALSYTTGVVQMKYETPYYRQTLT